MSFNRIYILGAGAIGSVYGALLSMENDITLIGNKAHMDAVKSEGLSISGDINEIFYLKTDVKIQEIPEKTLIIVTTKAYDLVKAVEGLKDLLRKDTIILILQNGLGNEETIRHITADSMAGVFRGITTIAAEFIEPGNIRFWNGKTIIEKSKDTEKIAALFNRCGIKTELSGSINRDVWIKLAVNCVANPLSAIFRIKSFEIAMDSLKEIRRKIVEECIEIGTAEGVIFPENLEKAIDEKISEYTNFSSMCQDIMKKKRTEIDYINGKIVELGKKHHIPTPVNETLMSLIKFLEEKNGIPGEDQAKKR